MTTRPSSPYHTAMITGIYALRDGLRAIMRAGVEPQLRPSSASRPSDRRGTSSGPLDRPVLLPAHRRRRGRGHPKPEKAITHDRHHRPTRDRAQAVDRHGVVGKSRNRRHVRHRQLLRPHGRSTSAAAHCTTTNARRPRRPTNETDPHFRRAARRKPTASKP